MDALLKDKSIHGVTLRSPEVNAVAGDPFNPLGPSAVPHPKPKPSLKGINWEMFHCMRTS